MDIRNTFLGYTGDDCATEHKISETTPTPSLLSNPFPFSLHLSPKSAQHIACINATNPTNTPTFQLALTPGTAALVPAGGSSSWLSADFNAK